jgi:ATP-dependent Zn protease
MLARAIAPVIASPQRRALTAAHEAGHALVAHRVGHRLIATTIEPRAQLPRGVVLGLSVARGELHTRADHERACIALLGGAAVEKLVLGTPRWQRAASDVQKAIALLGGDVQRLGTLWVATVRIVRAERDAIGRIAAQLVREGTLDGRDVVRLIGDGR